MKHQLILFLFSFCVVIQLSGQHFKSNYHPEAKYAGEWNIDMARSHSTEDGGIFITKISLTEDVTWLDSLAVKIKDYQQEKLFIIGVDTLYGFQISSIGRETMSLQSVKHDTTYQLNGGYAIIRSMNVSKLIFFPHEKEIKSEFGDFIALEIIPGFKTGDNKLHIGWALIKGEYLLEKGAKLFEPKTRNKSKYLNYYELSGKVKSVYVKSFASRNISTGSFVLGQFTGWERMEFNDKGEFIKLISLQRGYGGKEPWIHFYTLKGNYAKNTMIGNEKSDAVPDSIQYTRSSTAETSIAWTDGKKRYESTGDLINGQISRIKYASEYGYSEEKYVFNEKGDKISYTLSSSNERGSKEYFYIHLAYDEKGNWIKRVLLTPRYERQDAIEVREITYY